MIRDEQSLSRLLARLADGDYHSGDELGECLGVSRAAVWKQLRKLDDLGLELESVRGKGYRLAGGLEMLDPQKLRSALSAETLSVVSALDILTTTDSTNSRALERAAEGRTGYVCLAEHQSAGRGRRGRTWVSPFGRNLYLSLGWSFEGGASQLEGLSLAVGVALCQVLERHGLTGLALKWPNDVLWRGKKLAGILLEMAGDPAGACHVVVGVGMNLAMPPEAAKQIEQPWVDLGSVCDQESCQWPERNALAASLIERLVSLLSHYHRTGFSHWRQEWQGRDAFSGRPVRLSSGTRVLEGIARGVDETGALRLDVNGELVRCHGGELSMRAVS
ncbi:bifunctional biotin--[acetyl-CoA-carboxylase] ligase/biotin operon repressor BirA [Marinimicrobium agarilyticum]|uniref:bifunctional biotin--[acetyl-CoA-carboxylase] ligase/biotin operon repressor BirA n=1 Tax=Marinimicrobium agarilyticum TaxID=306546 RepID=UPI0003F9212E|nr:bifunctional biotin--[acetyl-CoA-carboxylase] ligase/biotin operon repressor BirA [Marinimicrobium agarilyticum]